MKRAVTTLAILALAAVALTAPAPLSCAAPQTGAQPASLASAPLRTRVRKETVVAGLERLVPRLMSEADVPGLSIALVRDGRVAWRRGFGVRNAATKEPVTNETVFEAASLSKPVFAYAVLKLVDAGKLDLDAPLQKYLPGDYEVGPDPRLAQITARRVLSHTTGFPNWRTGGPGAAVPVKIHFTPGERFSYSGEGFVYLSKAVERVTGEQLDAFMKRTVFDPLGMNASSYIWQERYGALKVFGHNAANEPTGQNRQEKANAAGSLHTTAGDYGRFVSAVLRGEGLRRETARLMLTPQVRLGEHTNTVNRPAGTPSPYISWGLGWGLQGTPQGVSFWHWGDNGNTKAYVVAFEREKTGVVVFANSTHGLSIIREIVDEAVGGFHPALDLIRNESYKSPSRKLLKDILARGAADAIADYRERSKGRAAGEVLDEVMMNRLGYNLLALKKVKDAIEVFKLNVELYPQSSNVYDSLGEAYMADGDKEPAIKNYQKSLELNPQNAGAVEALKKLQAP
jgi:CubicO group peptidase (beta-lactamase class C family)